MSSLSRRRFTRLMVGGIATSLLSNCTPGTPQATVTAIPAPTRAHTPTPTPSRPLLRNDNVPGFFVRYFRPFAAIDPDRWSLAVEGLIRNPQNLSLVNVLALPRVSQVSRMKCVECWSAAAKWEGFHLSSLLELVGPQPEATWLHFRCADDYYESMPIDELLQERVIFVHHMNDTLLPDIYGAPLRLMVPFLYGYKSAKAIDRIEFAAEELPGYWPSVGPYTKTGAIRPGTDHPLDIAGNRQINGGGEIFYEDGLEAQDRKQEP
jgi:sulfoxide reductase catalytic subunit YedY